MSETKGMDEQDQVPGDGADAGGDGISLVDLAAVLWRRRLVIVLVTAVAALASVIYALTLPNLYVASATILPISGSGSSSLVSQYASLAALAGVNLGSGVASTSSSKIETILKSRTFAENLIGRLKLVDQLVDHPETIVKGTALGAAVESLGRVLSVSTDTKTNLMKISAKTKQPTLSSRIANGALDLIQEDLADRILTSSGKNIALLEAQTADQEKKVHAAQTKLAAYQRKYNLISPDTQSSAGFQIYQNLIQQKMALEVEIQRLESALSEDNPKIKAARSEIDAIRNQMAAFEKSGSGIGPSMKEAPSALMEYANITAELEMATKVYTTLFSSLESMKLQDDTDKVFVEVIDRAIPPERRSEPSRSKICAIGTFVGGFLSLLLVFSMEALGRVIADPEAKAKFSRKKKLSRF